MDATSFGQYSLPVILSLFLGVIYKFVNVSDRWKSPIAVLLGIILGIVAMYYNVLDEITIKITIDYILFGFVSGAAATGIYELQRAAVRPRK